MNRVLVRAEELDGAGMVTLRDRRARHLLEVLNVQPGQEVRAGVLNGPLASGRIERVEPGCVSLRLKLGRTPEAGRTDLLLALPRPRVMRRLWAQLAALGVGRIALTNAARVERYYFDTHWLAPAHYKPLLIEGLQQAGDTRLPEVSIHKRLRVFLADDLERLFPNRRRLLAHPAARGTLLSTPLEPGERVLLAVGPEGGWIPHELELLAGRGFEKVSLGPRTLRTDTACVALLAALTALQELYLRPLR